MTTIRTENEPWPWAEVHELKCLPEWFQAIATGKKTWEVRLNDRCFMEGDHLVLREWDPETRRYTGASLVARVDYLTTLSILPNRDSKPWVGMSIHLTKVLE